jgi:hypothetical protein
MIVLDFQAITFAYALIWATAKAKTASENRSNANLNNAGIVEKTPPPPDYEPQMTADQKKPISGFASNPFSNPYKKSLSQDKDGQLNNFVSYIK